MMLNQKYLEIISHLRRNSRKQLTKIAKDINYAVTTTHDYYKRLNKYFYKHTTIIDFTKLGYKIRSFFILSLKQNKKIDDFLINHKQINNIYKLEGDKIFIDILFNSMQNQFEFIEKLEENKIQVIDEYKIIEELKIEEFDPIKHINNM